MEYAHNLGVEFVFIGEGAEKEQLLELTKEYTYKSSVLNYSLKSGILQIPFMT